MWAIDLNKKGGDYVKVDSKFLYTVFLYNYFLASRISMVTTLALRSIE